MDILEMPISRKVDMRKLTGKQKGKVQENVNRSRRRLGEGVSSKQPKLGGKTQDGNIKKLRLSDTACCLLTFVQSIAR